MHALKWIASHFCFAELETLCRVINCTLVVCYSILTVKPHILDIWLESQTMEFLMLFVRLCLTLIKFMNTLIFGEFFLFQSKKDCI